MATKSHHNRREKDDCDAHYMSNRWVVILGDPDDNDWSPWSVVANDVDAAVKVAIKDWRRWSGLRDEPEVVKVYASSWIDHRVL